MLKRELLAVVVICASAFSFTLANAQPSTPSLPLPPWQRNAQRMAQARHTQAPKKPIGKCGKTPCDALISKAHTQGRVTVIVELNDQDLPPLPTSGDKKERQDKLHSRQAEVRQKQDAFLQRFRANHQVDVLARRANSASFGLRVDENALRDLMNDPDVKFISENVFVYPSLRTSVPLIGADYMWANGFTGSGNSVAILDTGVAADHPFFSVPPTSRVGYETCHSGGDIATTSLCPNGQTSQYGAGAAAPCSLPSCEHGTHVAGIAAGNGFGFSGVGKEVNIVAMQVFSAVAPSICPACITSSSLDFGSALDDVISIALPSSITAVNMSLGSLATYNSSCDGENPDITTRIENLRLMGVATVISAGNNSCKDQNGYPTGCSNGISFPACISSAISVGATTKADIVAPYGNSAANLSLFAPGGDGVANRTLSSDCSEGYGAICSSVPGGGFEWLSGTSMAAPHVAGAFALVKSQSPTASVGDILSMLQSSGVPVTDSRNNITVPRIQLRTVSWLYRYNNPGGATKDMLAKVSSDPTGNVYATGISDNPTTGQTDYTTVKTNASGQLQWATRFNDGVTAEATGIVTDANGNVYVGGDVCKAVDIYGRCSDDEIELVKYDTNGNLQWVTTGPGGVLAWVSDMRTDANGNVYLAGITYADPNGAPFSQWITVKYDSSGNKVWVAKSAQNNGEPEALTIDANGNVYVVGRICVGPTADASCTSESAGIIKYDATGNQLWLASYGGFGTNGSAIAVDATGNVYSANGGCSTVDQYGTCIGGGITVAKHDANGNRLYMTSYGPDSGVATSIQVDQAGNAFVAGSTYVWVNDNQEASYLVIKIDSAGNLVWDRPIIAQDGRATSLLLDGGNLDVVGYVCTTDPSLGQCVDYNITSVKYDTDGNQLWRRDLKAGDGVLDFGVSIARGVLGSIYVGSSSCTAPDPSGGSCTYDVGADYAILHYSP